jgi:hypothetical protein
LLPLRKVIARDIERLKALPLADVRPASPCASRAWSAPWMPCRWPSRPSRAPSLRGARFGRPSAAGYKEKLLGELWRS